MFLSKLFKRNTEAKEHLRDNRGDENVTKMIWVVIVFVVGALLLTIVSSAFSGKVADWYDGTMDSWFNESNGMYAIEGGNAGGAGAGGEQTPDVAEVIFTFYNTDTSYNETSETYEVTPGTTWAEWLAESPVGPDGYPIVMDTDEGGYYVTGAYYFGTSNYCCDPSIKPTDVIVDGAYYACYA